MNNTVTTSRKKAVSFLKHPFRWWKLRHMKYQAHRNSLRRPYIIPLPQLPSQVWLQWQELAEHCPEAGTENNIFRYRNADGAVFSALVEVDKWQGVFNLAGAEDSSALPITSVEFWALAMREHANTEELVQTDVQGAVFWNDGELHVYPVNMGKAFERFFREHLMH